MIRSKERQDRGPTTRSPRGVSYEKKYMHLPWMTLSWMPAFTVCKLKLGKSTKYKYHTLRWSFCQYKVAHVELMITQHWTQWVLLTQWIHHSLIWLISFWCGVALNSHRTIFYWLKNMVWCKSLVLIAANHIWWSFWHTLQSAPTLGSSKGFPSVPVCWLYLTSWHCSSCTPHSCNSRTWTSKSEIISQYGLL